MCKLAYSIKAAAEVASVEKSVIVVALQDRALAGRRVNGTIIILRADLARWLESTPDYFLAMGRIPESITR